MKVVLLAGGLGTRLREETEFRPKPMVMVGEQPIIWHIMSSYAHFGHKDFLVCAGYRGDVIKEYFLEFASRVSDFSVKLGPRPEVQYLEELKEMDWKVTISDTGDKTMTGGRLFKVRKYVKDDVFMCTYGDGLSNVDISELVQFHKSHGKIATITAIRPMSRFGALELTDKGVVQDFKEKPRADGWVNAGFFVFNKEIFDYLDDASILENEPLAALAGEGQLMAFKHDGFWQPMDTYREFTILNELWSSGRAPWKIW